MKRILAGIGFAIALATVAGLPQVAVAETAQAAQNLPVHRGKFWFHSDCITAGQQGIDRGHWSRYQCAEGWMWNLWTDR